MAKYSYSIEIKKIVRYEREFVHVVAENEAEAYKEAIKLVKANPDKYFDEVEKTEYKTSYLSRTVNPVEE